MTENASSYATSDRSHLKRHPERGTHERETIRKILAEGLICHLGFVQGGSPMVIPMAYGLLGDEVILHGSPGSRLMKSLGSGATVCLTVTHLDGLVLARSSFHSSMNYRSVVAFGTGRELTLREEKGIALDAFVDHVTPGRLEAARPTTVGEIDGTSVIALTLDEASAKVRLGPPKEPARDKELPVWAGIIPMAVSYGKPLAADNLLSGLAPPRFPSRSQIGRTEEL